MSAAPPPIPSKQNFLAEMLSEFPIVCVHFVPARGCLLPPHLATRTTCMFEYGLNQPVPIPDLMLARDGVVATLSFGREPFRTFVPWEAIFYIENPERTAGYMWHEDIPKKGEALVAMPEPEGGEVVLSLIGTPGPPPPESLRSPPRASLWVAGAKCDHPREDLTIAPEEGAAVLVSSYFLPCPTPGCSAGPKPEPQYPGLAAFDHHLRRKFEADRWVWEAFSCE